MTPEQYWTQLAAASDQAVRELCGYPVQQLTTSEGQGLPKPWWWRQAEQRAAIRDDWTSPDAAGHTGL